MTTKIEELFVDLRIAGIEQVENGSSTTLFLESTSSYALSIIVSLPTEVVSKYVGKNGKLIENS